MTDCEKPDQYVNLSDSEKNRMSYPTHTGQHPADANIGNVKIQSIDKHPPNGMTHISPDLNRLLNQHHDCCLLPPIVSNATCCDVEHSAVPDGASFSPNTDKEHVCDCDKSINRDLCQISSKLHGVNFDDNEPEETDVFNGIEYVVYRSELQMPDIMRLITKDLSEPYSIYTYRYFIHNWPKLCFLVSIPCRRKLTV